MTRADLGVRKTFDDFAGEVLVDFAVTGHGF
jgi:hypothetical protein